MLLVLFSAPELLFYPALLVAAVILIVKASAIVMHNACFFSSKCVLAYTKRYNTCSTRFVPLPIGVLS